MKWWDRFKVWRDGKWHIETCVCGESFKMYHILPGPIGIRSLERLGAEIMFHTKHQILNKERVTAKN